MKIIKKHFLCSQKAPTLFPFNPSYVSYVFSIYSETVDIFLQMTLTLNFDLELWILSNFDSQFCSVTCKITFVSMGVNSTNVLVYIALTFSIIRTRSKQFWIHSVKVHAPTPLLMFLQHIEQLKTLQYDSTTDKPLSSLKQTMWNNNLTKKQMFSSIFTMQILFVICTKFYHF